jgi:hypothetical protein
MWKVKINDQVLKSKLNENFGAKLEGFKASFSDFKILKVCCGFFWKKISLIG